MKKMILIFTLLFSGIAFSDNEPEVNEVKVYLGGQQTTETEFNVGESISLEVEAIDPLSLPLEYVFRLYRNCTYVFDIQTWSSANQLSYTFVNDDVTGCFSIIVGVKNNDGFDADSFYGDVQYGVRFSISPAGQKSKRFNRE